MLNAQMTLTFKEADGTTDRTEVFDKKTEDANFGEFNNHDVVVEPSLPMARVTFRVVDPIPSGNSLGVVRTYCKIRHEVAKETPSGIMLLPIIEEISTSTPVQFTRSERQVQLNRLIAVATHNHYLLNYLERQC